MNKTVADLELGKSGVVRGFSSDEHVLKLLEMGCLPESKITLKFKAPFEGPLYVSIAGNEMAIRRGVAKCILLY